MQRSAASGLCLHCLPMSHRKDPRLKWVDICSFLFYQLFYYLSCEIYKHKINAFFFFCPLLHAKQSFAPFPIVLILQSVLTLFRPMEFSIKLHEIKSGWSAVYNEFHGL